MGCSCISIIRSYQKFPQSSMLYSKTNSKFQKKKVFCWESSSNQLPHIIFETAASLNREDLVNLKEESMWRKIYQQDSIHQDKTEHVLETREANHMVTILRKDSSAAPVSETQLKYYHGHCHHIHLLMQKWDCYNFF